MSHIAHGRGRYGRPEACLLLCSEKSVCPFGSCGLVVASWVMLSIWASAMGIVRFDELFETLQVALVVGGEERLHHLDLSIASFGIALQGGVECEDLFIDSWRCRARRREGG